MSAGLARAWLWHCWDETAWLLGTAMDVQSHNYQLAHRIPRIGWLESMHKLEHNWTGMTRTVTEKSYNIQQAQVSVHPETQIVF